METSSGFKLCVCVYACVCESLWVRACVFARHTRLFLLDFQSAELLFWSAVSGLTTFCSSEENSITGCLDMSNGSSPVNRLGWKQTNARPSVCLLSQTHIWLVFAAPLLCFLSASCPKGEAKRCCITSSRLQEERSSVRTAHRVFVKCF